MGLFQIEGETANTQKKSERHSNVRRNKGAVGQEIRLKNHVSDYVGRSINCEPHMEPVVSKCRVLACTVSLLGTGLGEKAKDEKLKEELLTSACAGSLYSRPSAGAPSGRLSHVGRRDSALHKHVSYNRCMSHSYKLR